MEDKKYINTPMNYTGSKFKLLEQILPEFDYNKPYFIDLFTGGGSVYTNVLDKYEKVIANDIIEDLVGIHNGLLQNDDIIEQVKGLCPEKGDKEGFLRLREDYNKDKSAVKLWALMLCCQNNLMRFNQKFQFNQTYGDRRFNDSTQKKVIEYVNHIRQYADKIRYISKSFNEIKIPNDKFMVYIDPPYGAIKNDDGSIGKKAISEAGYNCYFSSNDDLNLYEYVKELDKIGASFVLSGVLKHNGFTCWILDKLIQDGYNYKELIYDYNKVSRVGNKETVEIIVKNF